MSRSILFGLIAFILLGCTRDDICPEDTAATPLLVIAFNDRTDPTSEKNVTDLQIETNEAEPVLVFSASDGVSTVSIPLDTNNDTSSFRFITNTGDEDEENIDIVNFTYERTSSYVNRACSFKVVYTNLTAVRENQGSDNWIFTLILNKTTVEDETETHLTMLH
jgi:hypothetical protein